MSRTKCIIMASIVLLAGGVQAGEIKVHQWPAQFVPLEISTFPVVLDVGFWVEIINQDEVIKLQQIEVHKYQGCIDLQVMTNFALALSCSIMPTGAVGGNYSCFIENSEITPPFGIARLCATLNNANIITVPGGTTNIHVANVTVRVVPR